MPGAMSTFGPFNGVTSYRRVTALSMQNALVGVTNYANHLGLSHR